MDEEKIIEVFSREFSLLKNEINSNMNSFKNEINSNMNSFKDDIHNDMNLFENDLQTQLNILNTKLDDTKNDLQTQLNILNTKVDNIDNTVKFIEVEHGEKLDLLCGEIVGNNTKHYFYDRDFEKIHNILDTHNDKIEYLEFCKNN